MSIKEKIENEISLNEAKIQRLIENSIDIMKRIKENTERTPEELSIADIYVFKSLKSGTEALERVHANIVAINAENDKLKFILSEDK